jgi:hypothetical protein
MIVLPYRTALASIASAVAVRDEQFLFPLAGAPTLLFPLITALASAVERIRLRPVLVSLERSCVKLIISLHPQANISKQRRSAEF